MGGFECPPYEGGQPVERSDRQGVAHTPRLIQVSPISNLPPLCYLDNRALPFPVEVDPQDYADSVCDGCCKLAHGIIHRLLFAWQRPVHYFLNRILDPARLLPRPAAGSTDVVAGSQ